MADQFTAGETFTEDEQVTHTKLNLAQTNLKFTDDAVDGTTLQRSGEKLAVKNGGIDTAQLNDAAVETAKINDGAVTNAKLGADSVNGSKIADNCIDREHYVDASIYHDHLNGDVIQGQDALNAVPHLTQDEILISDNGTLKKIALMKHLPLPRAYGLIKMNGYPGTGNAVSLYGCSCSAYASGSYTINLDAAMSSADYTVLITSHATTPWDDDTDNRAVQLVDASNFKIHSGTGGAFLTSLHISFAVFGTLA